MDLSRFLAFGEPTQNVNAVGEHAEIEQVGDADRGNRPGETRPARTIHAEEPACQKRGHHDQEIETRERRSQCSRTDPIAAPPAPHTARHGIAGKPDDGNRQTRRAVDRQDEDGRGRRSPNPADRTRSPRGHHARPAATHSTSCSGDRGTSSGRASIARTATSQEFASERKEVCRSRARPNARSRRASVRRGSANSPTDPADIQAANRPAVQRNHGRRNNGCRRLVHH